MTAEPLEPRGDEIASLAVVLGPCDDMRAEVFVRGAVPQGGGRLHLEGTLTGPQCRRAITLPVSARLQDIPAPPDASATVAGARSGPMAAVARVVLTEPSFWTPDLPNLYRLEARLRCEGRDVVGIDRLIGLRRLGVRGRSFWLDGRRWVPRCVACEAAASEAAAAADAFATAYVVDPDERLLDTADGHGAAVFAVLPAGVTVDDAVTRIQRWSLHAAVLGVVMPLQDAVVTTEAVATATRGLRGTLLLGCAARGDMPPSVPPPGVDFLAVMLAADGLPDAAWRAPPAVPLVAVRPAGVQAADIAARRTACDRLQADLAGWGLVGGQGPRAWEWAGYAVT